MEMQSLMQKGRTFLFFSIAVFGWFVYLFIGMFLLVLAVMFQFFKWFILQNLFGMYFEALGETIGGQLLDLWRWIRRRIPGVLDFIGLPPVPQELAYLNPNNLPCLVVRSATILAKPNLITFCLGLAALGFWGFAEAHTLLTTARYAAECLHSDCD
jgi:hypothetical protein